MSLSFSDKLPPMDLKKATVLITGGSSGIGQGLIPEFLGGGCKVVICGRREDALKKTQEKYPAISYFVADVETEKGRIALVEQATSKHPALNIVVNNAGTQRTVPVVKETAPWKELQSEIDINFASPIHLCYLFIPHLLKQPEAAIINVSSGLGWVPTTHAPVYCATKAGIHQFTMALRMSLHKTHVRVCEMVPPAVKSNLGGSHDFGEETDVYCKSAFSHFAAGELEFGHGFSDQGRLGDRSKIQEMGWNLHKHMKVPVYAADGGTHTQ